MKFLKYVGAVIVGLVVGQIVNISVILLSGLLYPMPPGMDWKDDEAMSKFISQLPMGAFVLVIAAHGFGAFVGAWLASRIAPERSYVPGIIITLMFLLGCILNLMRYPHPTWFGIVDVLAPIAFGIAGTHLASRRPLVGLAT